LRVPPCRPAITASPIPSAAADLLLFTDAEIERLKALLIMLNRRLAGTSLMRWTDRCSFSDAYPFRGLERKDFAASSTVAKIVIAPSSLRA